ncbi:GNAT family N-acetyltransferase [Blastococcus litoris]|uniref:GNAT family N-acetyltransferase n=1 Tax=Blastococcus litoris TaxID=2171622 RepID=UPI0013DF6B45|nr:GNAT family N-acetyltransferase [Blastococcus litoris]
MEPPPRAGDGRPLSRPGRRVRGATSDDLALVHDAELDYIREREPEQEAAWLRAVDRNRALWSDNLARTTVVELDGAAAGYAMWAVVDGTATVVTLHVRPTHRRHGLGRALLDLLTDDVRRAGHRELALGVHRENPARHLYESAGFTPDGEDGDHLLYRRQLAEP